MNVALILNYIFIVWCFYLIFDCWMQRPAMSPLEKVSWTVLIVILPGIGALLYVFVVMLLRER